MRWFVLILGFGVAAAAGFALLSGGAGGRGDGETGGGVGAAEASSATATSDVTVRRAAPEAAPAHAEVDDASRAALRRLLAEDDRPGGETSPQ